MHGVEFALSVRRLKDSVSEDRELPPLPWLCRLGMRFGLVPSMSWDPARSQPDRLWRFRLRACPVDGVVFLTRQMRTSDDPYWASLRALLADELGLNPATAVIGEWIPDEYSHIGLVVAESGEAYEVDYHDWPEPRFLSVERLVPGTSAWELYEGEGTLRVASEVIGRPIA